MVLRSLVVAACLLAFWSVLVGWLPKDLETGQGLWSDNLIAAERYLIGADEDGDYVALVGSSLSQLLPLDSVKGLPLYNLGLGGQGVGDGLNLLAAGEAPVLLLVEVNIIVKEDNEDFSVAASNLVSLAAIRNVPAFRQRYQPVGVGLGMARRARRGNKKAGPPTDRPLNEAGLRAKHEEYAKPVPIAELQSRLKTLSERLHPLETAGTKVVFFEVPVHPDLCDSPRARSIRSAVKATFPAPTYVYIPKPNCNDYLTTDGHHLGKKSAAAFARWLQQRLEEI